LTGSETWFLFGRKIRLNRKQRRLFQELFPMIFFKTALMIWLVFLASESLLVSDEEQDQRRRVSNKRITKNSLRSSLFSFYTSTRVRTSFRREPQ
jgi:ATP/ADP translocase